MSGLCFGPWATEQKTEYSLKDVSFDCVINGVKSETIKSDKNGCLTYIVYGQNRKKTTYIKLADERYTTNDSHYFTADGINDYIVSMVTIDGKAYADGTKLTYTVTEVSEEDPLPEETTPENPEKEPEQPKPSEPSKPSGEVQTGDEANIGIYVVAATIAFAVMFAKVMTKRKRA